MVEKQLTGIRELLVALSLGLFRLTGTAVDLFLDKEHPLAGPTPLAAAATLSFSIPARRPVVLRRIHTISPLPNPSIERYCTNYRLYCQMGK
jgi:hypothetical protein